jgi:hypothetical protein
MRPEWHPLTTAQKLGYLVQEAGEVQAAVGKTLLLGLDSLNPELPPEQQRTNKKWALFELHDLAGAIHIVREELQGSVTIGDLKVGDKFRVLDDVYSVAEVSDPDVTPLVYCRSELGEGHLDLAVDTRVEVVG